MSRLPRPAIGAPAPDVELYAGDGSLWCLADQRGHPVVLVFHRHIH